MSLIIEKNFPLNTLNTLGLSATAALFSTISNAEQLKTLQQELVFKRGLFILGGGSNILLTQNITQWVLLNKIKGIERIKEDKDFIWLKVGGGEIWHEFVLFCLQNDYYGIENLSLIPGTVGAAPIQNIGAYGVEVKDFIDAVWAWHLKENKEYIFKNEDCEFGYRDSVFKRKYRGDFFITHVVFKLKKQLTLNINYGDILKELEIAHQQPYTAKAVSDAVIKIRESKLPNPEEIGNAGSFFKNPVIDKNTFDSLVEKFPEIPHYPLPSSQIKIPAAWLIQQCGWKGYKENSIGVHKHQALVLVNYGNGKGSDLFELSEKIINSVFTKFGIHLEREVWVY